MHVSPKQYVAAWGIVRAKRHYRSLTDEHLWHKVYETYIDLLPPAELGASRDELIERHLRILRPIAGQIVWKRFPIKSDERLNRAVLMVPKTWREGHEGACPAALVHELAAFGVFGLFIAADRYKPASGWAFSTYANYWIKKFVRLYLDELVGIVPRTGEVSDGPRRSVMDLVDAALAHRRVYRGKAAGGMPRFDCGLTIPGLNPGDEEIEIVGSDGPTDQTRPDYLQRCPVGMWLYPWLDMGAHFTPRLALPGHPGGKAHDGPTQEIAYELDPRDQIDFTRGKRELKTNDPPGLIWPHRDIRPGWSSDPIRDNTYLRPIALVSDKPSERPGKPHIIPFLHLPHEVCYLAKQRPDRQYNSWDKFGEIAYTKPKTMTIPDVPHWHNSIPFAVDYLRRCGRRRPWRKPSITEWCAQSLAA